MSFNFQTKTHGKWILSGEHAVIRSHPSLAFPLTSKTLTLCFQQTKSALQADFDGVYPRKAQDSFWRIVQYGCQLLNQPYTSLTGKFYIHNLIPIGIGLGSSAAICVALARWFEWRGWLDTELLIFARKLEHLFHQSSSGLDIAAANATQGILFQQQKIYPVEQNWQPCWALSLGKSNSQTALSVQKVHSLWQRDPTQAKQIDEAMANSVRLAKKALAAKAVEGRALLIKAIQQAHYCFTHWDLISPSTKNRIQQLLTNGALAVKPTGAGGGGSLLSLWNTPKNIPKMLSGRATICLTKIA